MAYSLTGCYRPCLKLVKVLTWLTRRFCKNSSKLIVPFPSLSNLVNIARASCKQNNTALYTLHYTTVKLLPSIHYWVKLKHPEQGYTTELDRQSVHFIEVLLNLSQLVEYMHTEHVYIHTDEYNIHLVVTQIYTALQYPNMSQTKERRATVKE